MIVLKTEGLTKVYTSQGKVTTKALSNFDLEVQKGEFVGIMGPSGSGKTTLLNLLATVDRPTAGRVLIEGVDTAKLKGEKLAAFRRRKLGFVFQDFNLLDTLTIGENIALPLVLERLGANVIKKAVHDITKELGIEGIISKYPYEVSGGQQQRAAAARAIVHGPAVLLADEPTGNLDSKSARELMETFARLNQSQGATIVMVTHDPFAASFCQRIVFIRDGQRYSELHRGENRQLFFQRILDALSMIGGEQGEPEAPRL